MKTIYVFGTRGFPNVQGGVEKHCEQLYPEITGQYNIFVFRRLSFLKKNAEKMYKNVRFIDLPSTRLKGFEPFFHSFLCTIYCLLKKPDIVHIHNIGPGMFIPFLKLRRIKVILTYHSPNYEHKKWNYIARKILKFSEWIAVNGATAIIFVNQKQLDLFNDTIKRKSVYIPNGVSVKPVATATDYIDRLGLKPQKYILAVGRITQEKGFDYLLEAYSRGVPPDFKLVLAGGVDHASAYSSEISKKARMYDVVMTGYVDGEFLRQLYSHARLFVLPSYNEGFPLVLLEAMSYHLPLLASDIPANSLLNLNSEDYFKTGDISDLSEHLRQKLSQAFIRIDYKLDRFTWSRISEKVATLYGQLI